MNGFEDWIGRSQSVADVLTLARANALDVTLGDKGGLKVGDALPPLYHWLYFWDVKPPAGLGADGHPAKGDFLPPVRFPHRMWAGGRVTFHMPLLLGATVTRTSTISAISEKKGRSGGLVFVTVRHELDGGEGIAITEEHDLVYRERALAASPAPIPTSAPQAPWMETIDPDPVLLFRYSALTFNGHRIHYDRSYAVEEEGYPALVVHGPLQATLMARLAARRLDAPITRFDYRGHQPAFDGTPLHICGRPTAEGAEVWTQQGQGPNMVATVYYTGPI